MEVITISGTVYGQVERLTDKHGCPFVRFRVQCSHKRPDGTTRLTRYRCVSYVAGSNDIQTDEVIFLTGDFNESTRRDEKGQLWINNDIWVRSLSRYGTDAGNNMEEQQ